MGMRGGLTAQDSSLEGRRILRQRWSGRAEGTLRNWARRLQVWASGEWGCRRGSALGVQMPPSAGHSLLSSLSLPQMGTQHSPLVRFSSTC